MALQIRATSSASSNGSTTLVSTTVPAGTQAGDLLLVFVEATANNMTLTPTGGWTSISSITASNSSSSLRGARRVAQAGDAGTVVTHLMDTSTRWAAVVLAVYDTGGVTPRIEQTAISSGGNTTSPSTPAIDPAVANDLLIAIFGGTTTVNGDQPTLSAVGTYTLNAQISSTTTTLKNAVLGVATKPLPTDALVPAATHTSSGTLTQVGATILLSNVNTPPTANAGLDQTVSPGATVTLGGSGSDLDGSISSYAWSQISGTTVTLSSSTVAQPTFTAPISVEGAILVFGLIVTDNDGTASAQDTVTITVGAAPYQNVWNGTAFVKQPVRHWVGGNWVS